jgi:hypothetical protein
MSPASVATEVKQKPHGGKLIDLMVQGEDAIAAAMKRTTEKVELSDRQLCDVELLMNGGFSPLTGFMVRHDTHCFSGWSLALSVTCALRNTCPIGISL